MAPKERKQAETTGGKVNRHQNTTAKGDSGHMLCNNQHLGVALRGILIREGSIHLRGNEDVQVHVFREDQATKEGRKLPLLMSACAISLASISHHIMSRDFVRNTVSIE